MTHAYVERRGDRWCVIAREGNTLSIIGRYAAKFRANEHAERYNQTEGDDQ